VRDCREDLHAFVEIAGNAPLHGVEGACGLRHLGRPAFRHKRGLQVRAQLVRRGRQPLERPRDQAHARPRTGRQHQQLGEQQPGDPVRDRHRNPAREHTERRSITEAHLHAHRLRQVLELAHSQHRERAQCGGHDLDEARKGGRGRGRRVDDTLQGEGVVGPLQALEPVLPLAGGQPVQNGHRAGDVALDSADHQVHERLAPLVADGHIGQQLRERHAQHHEERGASQQGGRPEPPQE